MSGIVLRGLDGSNPLAFLAALGTLRLLNASRPEVRLRWVRRGVWHPELTDIEDLKEQALCELLVSTPHVPIDTFAELGKNITVQPGVFRRFVRMADGLATAQDTRAADFAASFGSEVCIEEKNERIQYSALCFITGSGHQDFLGTMKSLIRAVQPDHIRHALFESWDYADKGNSMRWDPADAREYALRWNNPGPEGAWTVWGANRLAVEGLPFFPSQPTSEGLATMGFRKVKRGWPEFTWPIWKHAVGLDTVRSLVAVKELQAESPDRSLLGARGIDEVYRAQRIRIGAGANFKVSFRTSRSA